MRSRKPAALAVGLIVSFSAGVLASPPAVAAGSLSDHRGTPPGAAVSGLGPRGVLPRISAMRMADSRHRFGAAGGGRGGRTASSVSGPALSPPQAAILPGIVIPLSGAPEGVAIDAAGMVAVSVRDPAAVVLFPINEPLARHTVPLGGSARHLSLAGPTGPLLVPEGTANTFVELNLPGGTSTESIRAGRGPTNAVALGSGTVAVVDQPGGTVQLISDGRIERTIEVPGGPGDLAADPDGSGFVVLSSRGRTLSEYTAAGNEVGTAPAGVNPTHVVAGSDGLYWVADTARGSVLGFKLGAHGPVHVTTINVGGPGSRPYGLAFDAARGTLWVTLTGANQLVGLHLRGTQVQGRTIEATVRQPNSVAVAPGSGAVVVTGSTPQGQVQFFGVQAS